MLSAAECISVYMRLQLLTAVVILMTFVMLQCNQKKTLRERKRVRNKSFNVAGWRYIRLVQVRLSEFVLVLSWLYPVFVLVELGKNLDMSFCLQKCFSDWEKLLKFEAQGENFQKISDN